MTVATEFTDWSNLAPPPYEEHSACSPNLVRLREWALGVWPLQNLGCFGRRPVRGGSKPSAHSFGAAIDLRWDPQITRDEFEQVLLLTLIRNSQEMHVQAIHDYIGCRIWRAGRTGDVEESEGLWWRAQAKNRINGMGQSWAGYVHIETSLSGWHDGSPFDTRS